MRQHECDRCAKKLSSYKSLWRHKRNGICQGSCGNYGDVSDVTVGQKRKASGKYSMFSDNRFPSMVTSSSAERQRMKGDIVGYSDDDGDKSQEKSKFDAARKEILDRIVNSPRKPSPVASPSHVI